MSCRIEIALPPTLKSTTHYRPVIRLIKGYIRRLGISRPCVGLAESPDWWNRRSPVVYQIKHKEPRWHVWLRFMAGRPNDHLGPYRDGKYFCYGFDRFMMLVARYSVKCGALEYTFVPWIQSSQESWFKADPIESGNGPSFRSEMIKKFASFKWVGRRAPRSYAIHRVCPQIPFLFLLSFEKI